jgi:gliding motility-associated-like protein
VGVNLGKYVGQQVSIICTTADCAQCGHFGYTYLDFSCGTTTSSQFCAGTNSVTVVAPTEPGATYSWTPTGASTQSITVNPLVVDTVTCYVNPPSGCGYFVNFILQPTVIKPALTYTLGCTTANFGDATTITGGTISSYSWTFPGGAPSSSNLQIPPTITYPPGTYTVTLNVVSQAGCTAASVPVVITIQPPPVVNAGADASICTGNSTVLNGSGTPPGGTYSWSPATNLNNTTIANPTAGPVTAPVTYTLTYTNSNGCKNTDVVNLSIGPPPVALASYVPSLTCDGVSVQFTDSSLDATGWTWDFGDGSSSTLQNPPVHIYEYNGVYVVTLIVTNANCRDTLVTPISIGDMNSFIKLIAPNVFTPNNDGENDCFQPMFSGPNADQLRQCTTMEIFDRWGIKIFESTGGYICWDGKTKSNTKAKDGTYYYLMSLGQTKFKGYVTLLRDKK